MFTLYALGAIVLIELLDRSLLTMDGLRRKLKTAVAYSTVFFAKEEVSLSSTSVWFIQEYEWIVQNHQSEAVWITREPCDGGTRATDAQYVCRPTWNQSEGIIRPFDHDRCTA